MKFTNQKGVSYWAIVIVLAFVVVAMIIAVWPQEQNVREYVNPKILWRNISNSNDDQQKSQLSEEILIDRWINANNLNKYGDPKDTMYAGGTPLFNESSGERIDRYEYIKNQHPDKPWLK